MRRCFINVILSTAFVLSAWVIARPFMAERVLEEARRLNTAYRWDVADKKFDMTMRLDPLGAEYNSAIGRLYAARASMVKDKIPALLKAEEKYKRAYQLNPYDVVNLMELAVVEKELFLSGPALYKDRMDSTLDYFNKASMLDPKNYIVNYKIGLNYVDLWKYLDDKDKRYAAERFKNCLKLAPDYYDEVYQIFLDKTKNKDLRKYRREIFDKSDADKKRTATGPEWSGKADDGVNVYKDGNIYWTGTASRTIELPEGRVLIKIKARGEQAFSIWPYMIVELDGEEIGETFVDTAQWKEYGFEADTDGGIKVLSVTFPNDGGDPARGTDRNLYVGEVKVEIASSQ